MSHLEDDAFDGIPAPPFAGDELASEYLLGLAAAELRIQRCVDCGLLQHPPRPICRRCASFNLATRPLSGKGILVSASAPFATLDPFAADDLMFRRAVVQLVEQDSLLLLTKLVAPAGLEPEGGLFVAAHFPLDAFGRPSLVFQPELDVLQPQDPARS